MQTQVLTRMEAGALTVSEIINVHIPRTNDRGDALAAAVQILDAAYQSLLGDPVPDYRLVTMRARNYLAAQHIQYLKGGE